MLIHAKIEPDSATDEVIEKNPVSFIVKVRAPAERNEANEAMLRVLSTYLKVHKNQLRIITGHHMPSKIIDVIEEK